MRQGSAAAALQGHRTTHTHTALCSVITGMHAALLRLHTCCKHFTVRLAPALAGSSGRQLLAAEYTANRLFPVHTSKGMPTTISQHILYCQYCSTLQEAAGLTAGIDQPIKGLPILMSALCIQHRASAAGRSCWRCSLVAKNNWRAAVKLSAGCNLCLQPAMPCCNVIAAVYQLM